MLPLLPPPLARTLTNRTSTGPLHLLLVLLLLLGGYAAQAANTIVPNISANSTAPAAGTTLTLTFTYANNYAGSGSNRTATITRSGTITGLPTGLTGVTFAGTGASGATYNSGQGSITFNTGAAGYDNTLPPGGTDLNFSMSFTVPVNMASFTVRSAPTTNTQATTVNPQSVTLTVAPVLPADISVTVSAPSTAPAGGQATINITATNTSTANTATNVVVTAQLATGLAAADVSISDFGTYNAGTGKVTFPAQSLAPNATFDPTIRLRMPANGTRTVQVSATSTLDNNAANNNGSASNANATITVTQAADVAISINGPTAATAGSSLVYSVLLTNQGPSTATGVTAQVVLGGSPTNVVVNGGGTLSGSTVSLTVPGGTLASGASLIYTIRFTVPSSGPVTGTASAASTTANGDPVAANNNGTADASKVTTAVVSSTPSEVCANPGVNGSLTYTGTQTLNTYYPGLTGTGAQNTAGQKVLAIGTARTTTPAGTALAIGDLVLVMQMQGAPIDYSNTSSYGDGYAGDPGSGNTGGSTFTAGQYEYGVVAAVTAGTVTLVNNLVNTYQNANATATNGQRRFQVIRVPQYQNFTLSANLTTTPAWDGTTGGVLAMDVAGTMNLAGFTVNLVGKGFRGGAGRQLNGQTGYSVTDYRTPATAALNGTKGEGIAGTPRYINGGGTAPTDLGTTFGYPNGTAVGGGDNGRGAPGNAGGGGTDTSPDDNQENTGGGGGSNGGFGGQGGNGWRSNLPYGGFGGAPFLQASPSRLILGGGGGAGTTNNGTVADDVTYPANVNLINNGFASSGAAGGGIVILRAGNVSGTGTIDVSGADMAYVPDNDGSGGGGAGGSVLLVSNNTSATALTGVTVLATGGNGGSNTGGGSAHGPGGGGSGGVIFATSAVNAASSAAAGTNGTTYNGIVYEAGPGTSSPAFVRSNVGFDETPLLQSGANCVADVTTALTGPAFLTPGQPSAPYTATFTNNGLGSAAAVTRTVTLPTGASLTTDQRNAITAAYPGTTFATTGTGTTAVTTITFPQANSVANGGSTSYTFVFTAPTTSGSVTLGSGTSTTTNQGADLAANSASLSLTVGNFPDVTTTLNGPTDLNTGLASGPYTVTFANVGTAAASTVTRTVTLPTGASLTTAQQSVITTAYPGTTFSTTGTGTAAVTTINFGNVTSLAAGASSSFAFSFTAPATVGAATLTSNVTTTTSEGNNAAPNVSTLNATVDAVADVAATITPIAGTATAGASGAGFNVSFANNGTLGAAGTVYTVQLPAGLTIYGAVTASNGGSYNNTTGLVTYAPSPTTLAAGGTFSSAITFTAPPSGPVAATASVRTTTSEAGRTANNTDAASLTVTPAFDLTTTLSGPATATQGNEVVLHVTTTNNGPSAAPNAVQTVQLIGGLQNVYVTNNGTYNSTSGLVTFPALASLPNGQTAANSISFTAPAVGTTLNPVATVTPNTTATGDVNPANNAAYLNGTNATMLFAAPTTLKANVLTTITPSAATVAAGSTLTLTVTQTNAGPTAATSVVERVQLLPGLTAGTLTLGGATGTLSGTTVTFASGATYSTTTGLLTLPTVTSQAPGASQTYTIAFPAPTTAGNNGELALTASVSTATSETVLADNLQATVVTVTPTTDVATTVGGPGAVVAGQVVTYTATFATNGPGIATGVARTVQLPTGLSGVVVSDLATGAAVTGAYNSTTGLVTLPTLSSQAAGNSTAFTLDFVAPAADFSVRSAVSSTTADGNAANNSASASTTVAGVADVAVALNGPTVAVIGNRVTYTATTTNSGPSPATGVATTVQLPTGLSDVTVSGTGTYNAGTGLVTFDAVSTLASGASATNAVTFTMPRASDGQLRGEASVTTTSTDPVAANNSFGVATSVVQPTTNLADVSTTLTLPGSATAGASLTATAVFANAGTAAALNVTPTLQLPAGLTVTAVSNGGSYNSATGLVTWPVIASQASGASVSYTVTLNAPATGPLRGTSTASAQTTDSNLTNNASAASTTITAAYDVVTSLGGPASSLPGATNTYTVTTTNNGPSTAPSVTPSVTLPSGVTATNITGGGTQSGTTINWPAVSGLMAGANGAVTYTFSVAMPGTGDLLLTSTAAASGELNTGNNGATLTTTRANQPPVANNLMNEKQAPRGNTAEQQPVSSLVANDADGSVATYQLTGTLPPTAQGVLYYNNNADGVSGAYVALGIGQNLTPAQAASLRFDAAAGYSGNVFYTYTATDNLGAVSNVATYGIPVGPDNAAVYATTPVKGNATRYATNDVLAYVVDPNGALYNPSGLIYDATTGALQTGTRNGLATTGTNAVLATTGPAGNPGNTLPTGTALNPATGQIYVSNASQLPGVTSATSYSVNVTTTDVYGGVTTQTVTFTIGAYPLPVELVAFTAQAVRNVDAQLNWTTAQEKDNDHFDVERSLDGRNFVRVATRQGQGTKTSATQYAWTDAGVAHLGRTLYYRLKQVDRDGTSTYSDIRAVAFSAAVPGSANLYPNPASETTTLDLTQLPASSFQVRIVDAAGRLAADLTLTGGAKHTLTVASLARGTYAVLLRGHTPEGKPLVLTLRLYKE